VEQGDALLHDVAQPAQSLDGLASTWRDDRLGLPLLAGVAEPGAVVALVRQQDWEPSAGSARRPTMGGTASSRLTAPADVGDVATRGDHLQWGARTVGDHMMLAARLAPVDRSLALLLAVMCPPSTNARDQSIRPAAFSSASSSRCSRSNTPASVHPRSLRQQVIPEP